VVSNRKFSKDIIDKTFENWKEVLGTREDKLIFFGFHIKNEDTPAAASVNRGSNSLREIWGFFVLAILIKSVIFSNPIVD